MSTVVLVSSLLAVLLALLISKNRLRRAGQAILSPLPPQTKRPEDPPPVTPELQPRGLGQRACAGRGLTWVGKPWPELFHEELSLDEVPDFGGEDERQPPCGPTPI